VPLVRAAALRRARSQKVGSSLVALLDRLAGPKSAPGPPPVLILGLSFQTVWIMM
jgi:hypothetical protein